VAVTLRFRARCLVVLLVFASLAAGQDQVSELGEAKRLYDSADYLAALATMAAIDSDAMSREQAAEKALYEALCLIALDNKPLAEARVKEMVQADPLFRSSPKLPPKVTAFIDNVVDQLRPSLVHEHFAAGRALFDQADYTAALHEFGIVADLTKDDTSPTLADMRTLADGFSQAARAWLAAPTEPPGVEPPVTLRQNLPAVPPTLAQHFGPGTLSGVLELTINEQGSVESVTVVKSIHPAYDVLLVTAAKQWKYRPAMQNGVPVPFVKRLDVNVAIQSNGDNPQPQF
jgi:TonB family protein